MNVTLTRLQLKRRPRSCAKPNQEQPISGWMLALVVVLVLAFGVGLDIHTAIAEILK